MNQAEIEAVWLIHIPIVDRLFYHYLRDVVADYATKTVGIKFSIRKSTIVDAFAFEPELGSKLPPFRITVKQVGHMIDRAVARGWISRRYVNGKAIPMQFSLDLVKKNFSGRNDERSMSGQGKGGHDGEVKTDKNTVNTVACANNRYEQRAVVGNHKNTYDGDISSISSNNSLSNTREGVSAISVDNFQIDDLLINRLRLSGVKLSLPENREQLQLALVKFQSSEKYFSQLKPIDHWRKLFVGYYASWSANSSRGHYAKSSQKSESSQQAVRSAILSGSRRNFVDIN